ELIATWNPARGAWETTSPVVLCGHLEPYSQTWPTSGMTRRGRAYALPTWEPPTAGSASSSSPGPLLGTPTSWEQRSNPDTDERNLLPLQVQRLLPTPRATDGTKGGPNQRGSSGDLMLPSAVCSLPPP